MNVIRDTAPFADAALNFGSGLGKGLQTLAQHKMESILEQKQIMKKKAGLKALADAGIIGKDQAEGLAQLPDNLLDTVLTGIYKNQYQAQSGQGGASGAGGENNQSAYLLGEQPQEQQQQPLAQLAAAGQQPSQVPGKPSMEQMVASGQKPIQPEILPQLKNLGYGEKIKTSPDLITPEGQMSVSNMAKKASGQQYKQPKQRQWQNVNPEMIQKIAKGEMPNDNVKLPEEALEAESKIKQEASAQDKKLAETAIRRNPNVDAKTILTAMDKTAETRETLLAQKRAADNSNMRIGRIEQLDKEDKIQGRFERWFRGKVGLGGTEFANEQTQELEKLSNDFVRDIKLIFGSRVTNLDLDTFMKTIPTLMQSKGGRARVMRNLKIFNEGAKLRYDEGQRIIKENNGIPPIRLDEMIENNLKNKLDRLNEKFVFGDRKDKYQAGHEFDQKPKASDIEYGKSILNKATGKREYAGGTRWIPEDEWKASGGQVKNNEQE